MDKSEGDVLKYFKHSDFYHCKRIWRKRTVVGINGQKDMVMKER